MCIILGITDRHKNRPLLDEQKKIYISSTQIPQQTTLPLPFFPEGKKEGEGWFVVGFEPGTLGLTCQPLTHNAPGGGKRKGKGGSWWDSNQKPWDLHVNPLPIMLPWVPSILYLYIMQANPLPTMLRVNFYYLVMGGSCMWSYWINLM